MPNETHQSSPADANAARPGTPRSPYTPLAPGLTIARVLTGLWQVADLERSGSALDAPTAARALADYADAGFTSFDMADHYGTAELIAGELVKLRGKGSVQLLTKWVPPPGRVTAAEVRAAVDRARERLHVDAIDLLQYHAWAYRDPAWLDALFLLDQERVAGRITALGVTNFDTTHLRVAVESGLPIVSNQLSFSLLDQRAAGAMADYCLSRGIKLLAYGTVAGGLLSERWVGKPAPDLEDPATSWSVMKYSRFVEQIGGWGALQELLTVVQRVAARRGVSMANVACRYILDHPAVGAIVVGARVGQRDHIQDTKRLLDLSLSTDDRADLAAALTSLRPIPGDCGDEYRRPPYLTASGDLSHHVATFPAPYEVEERADGSARVFSGTAWEPMAGYCRAIKRGAAIHVSGTTATHGDRLIGGRDAFAQAAFVLDKIEGALASLGASLDHVVRTRIFVSDTSHWEAVARAHGERFRHAPPANTLVGAPLIGSEYLVEIEADALLPT